jgi:hypothetical protein
MGDREQLIEISEKLAGAIARRDTAAVRGFLAGGFMQRPAGGEAVGADAFLAGVAKIPGDILFVKVDQITTDIAGDHAVVTGIQQAQLKIDGAVVTDRRPFVDWFVREDGVWRVRLAVDLPAS